MAKSVMGEIDEEFFKDLKPVPEVGPATGRFVPTPLPQPAGVRQDFGDYLSNQLKLGFSDLAMLLGRVSEYEKEKVFKGQPVFGFEPAVQPESMVQRAVGGGMRAVPSVALPVPLRGATLFAPGRVGAITGAFGAGAGAEFLGGVTEQAGYGRLAGELTGAITGGATSQIVGDALSSIFTGQLKNIGLSTYSKLLNGIKQNVGEEQYQQLLSASNKEAMDRILKENPDLLQQLSRVEELQKLIPGFNPNLFQATGATTVRIRGQATLGRRPEAISGVEAQQKASDIALRQKVADLFPSTESSYVFAGRQLDRTQSAIASLVNSADQNIQKLSSQFTKTGAQDLGEQIRKAYGDRRSATYDVFQKQYDALDADAAAKGVALSPESTQNIYNFATANRQVFEDNPQLLNLIETAFKPKTTPAGAILSETGQPITGAGQEFAPTSFKDLRSLYRQVNQDFYKADQAASQNVPGAGLKVKVLSDLKDQVLQNIESLPADVKDRFFSINSAYDADYRQVFKKGLGGLIGAETRMGARVKDEDIINQLTKESNVDDFYRIFGNTPETQQYLKAGLIDKFLKQGKALNADGTINQTALLNFTRTNEGVINKIPELQGFLTNSLDELARFADQKASLVQGQQALERSALRAITKKQDLDAIFTTNQSGAFENLDRLSAIIGSAKADPNGNALKGVQGIMMDRALSTADPLEFINKNEKAFKRAFGNDYKTVRDLAEAGQILGRTLEVVPPVRVLEGDIAQQTTGTSIPGAYSLLRDRITSVPTKISILFSRFSQAKGLEAKDNAFLELYKDPDKAREALKYINTFNSAKASEQAKEVALSGLNKLLVRSGVNLYRAGVVTGMREAGMPEAQPQAEEGFNFNELTPVE
jgi:hypothetical protein